MSLPVFADSQCDYVEPVQQEWLTEQIAKGKKNLLFTDLRGADLVEADLTKADLRKADLYMANLTEANLTEADLHATNFTEADLTGANLRGAKLGGDFTEANLNRAIIDSKYREQIMASLALNTDKINWVD